MFKRIGLWLKEWAGARSAADGWRQQYVSASKNAVVVLGRCIDAEHRANSLKAELTRELHLHAVSRSDNIRLRTRIAILEKRLQEFER